MNYPKYTREENRACKLTQQQIDDIPVLRSQDLTFKNIGDLYGVKAEAIFFWSLSEKERKRRRLAYRNKDTKESYDIRSYRKRKKETHPELTQYERYASKRNYTKHREQKLKHQREVYKKNHPESINYKKIR